jgi:hypothetical protein
LIKRIVLAAAIAMAGGLIVAARARRGGVRAHGIEIATRTIDSVAGGQRYWEQCQANDVPFPPPWGPSTFGESAGRWKARGTMGDSYITTLPVDIYTMTSTSPPGVCAIAIRADGTFDVICQGTNGKACFWEADPSFWPKHGIRSPLPRLPKSGEADISIVGLVPAAPDQRVQCTPCHAGENAFITHTTSGHPTNLRALPGWMPSALYTPIVPKEWSRSAALSTKDYPISCLGGCHDVGGPRGAGRLPRLRGADGQYCELLRTVTSIAASRGGMPPGAADCTATKDCPLDADVKKILASCGSASP